MGRPLSWRLYDWTSGSGVPVGVSNFSVVRPDIAPVDKELFCEMGVAQVRRSQAAIAFDGFEFGGVTFHAVGKAFDGTDLDQALFGMTPIAGPWATYPYSDTFLLSARTHPRAFKIELYDGLNATGVLVGTVQMRDGLPINSPALSQVWNTSNAVRPLVNCGQLLYWGNKAPKENLGYKKFFPGYTMQKRESEGRRRYAVNAAVPVARYGSAGQQQQNGSLHYYHMEKWPSADLVSLQSSTDPYDYNAYATEPVSSPIYPSVPENKSGWGYEPGAVGGHDLYTGPGGTRFDRAGVPEALALHTVNPSYVHKFRNTPIAEMAWDWSLNYFNHSVNYITDVKQLGTTVSGPSVWATHSIMNAYYGIGPFGSASININAVGMANGLLVPDPTNDPNLYDTTAGQRFWNGNLFDDNHLHQVPYEAVLKWASPAHFVASRSTYAMSFLVRLGERNHTLRPINDLGMGNSNQNGLTRRQAYLLLHHVLAWKTATNDSLGVTRADVLLKCQQELEFFWLNHAQPSSLNTTDPIHVALNRLGVICQYVQKSNGSHEIIMETTSLVYYFNEVFLWLKSFGMWQEVILNANAKKALEWIMDKLNKHAIDMALDTDSRWLTGMTLGGGVFTPNVITPFLSTSSPSNFNAGDIPANWAALAALVPPAGQEGFGTDASGAQTFNDHYSGQHMMARWPKIMQDWYPEYNYPRTAAAVAYYANKYAARAAFVATAPAGVSQSNIDWVYRFQSHQPTQSPTDVGATLVAGVKTMPTGVEQITSTLSTVSFATSGNAQVTLTSLDICGNPIAGATIAYTSSNPAFGVVPNLIVTNASGQALVTISSATDGTSVLTFNRVGSTVTAAVNAAATTVTVPPTYTGPNSINAPGTVAANGTAPITYVFSGAAPSGLSIDPATGGVTGTVPGTYSVVVVATNSAGSLNIPLSITVPAAPLQVYKLASFGDTIVTYGGKLLKIII